MTDIVERLRTCGPSMWSPHEAADEIERLRDKVENRERLRAMQDDVIERLREETRWQSFRIADKDCLIEKLEARNAELEAALQGCVEYVKQNHNANGGWWNDPKARERVKVIDAALAKEEEEE